jgi:hypothetical protein
MSLPIFKTNDQSVTFLQTQWASQLNPLLSNPVNSAIILPNIKLNVGVNSVNTTLGRTLQGWFIVRQRAKASIYDVQDANSNPQLTLALTSDTVVTVDIAVF